MARPPQATPACRTHHPGHHPRSDGWILKRSPQHRTLIVNADEGSAHTTAGSASGPHSLETPGAPAAPAPTGEHGDFGQVAGSTKAAERELRDFEKQYHVTMEAEMRRLRRELRKRRSVYATHGRKRRRKQQKTGRKWNHW